MKTGLFLLQLALVVSTIIQGKKLRLEKGNKLDMYFNLIVFLGIYYSIKIREMSFLSSRRRSRIIHGKHHGCKYFNGPRQYNNEDEHILTNKLDFSKKG